MDTWYVLEYTYSKLESGNITYRGSKEFDSVEELTKVAAIIYFLLNSKSQVNSYKHSKLFKEYFGKQGRFERLKKIYKYTKKEIPLVDSKNGYKKVVNM